MSVKSGEGDSQCMLIGGLEWLAVTGSNFLGNELEKGRRKGQTFVEKDLSVSCFDRVHIWKRTEVISMARNSGV